MNRKFEFLHTLLPIHYSDSPFKLASIQVFIEPLSSQELFVISLFNFTMGRLVIVPKGKAVYFFADVISESEGYLCGYSGHDIPL